MTSKSSRPQPIHFLKVGGVALEPLCGAANVKLPEGDVTALIERVTCPQCLKLLNLMLAGKLNGGARRN